MTRTQRIVLSTFLLVVLVGALAVFGSGAARSARQPAISPTPRFPAFEMVREETRNGVTRTYHFSYTDDWTWKQTLVSRTGGDPRSLIRAGNSMELRDGQMIFTVAGSTHSGPVDRTGGYHLPGDWFYDAKLFRGFHHVRGAIMSTAQSAGDTVLTVVDGPATMVLRLDTATGVPVGYERRVDGDVIERHAVTALTVAGQTVR